MATYLSPLPQSSAVVIKEKLTLTNDWLNWLYELSRYAVRLLNRYDSTLSDLATLVGGTKVIANTKITSTSRIRLTAQTSSGTPGILSIVLNAGVGFTIMSSSGTDTSTVFYEIVEGF